MPLYHSISEQCQHFFRIFPADTRVGDTLSISERFARLKLLRALDQITFRHKTDDQEGDERFAHAQFGDHCGRVEGWVWPQRLRCRSDNFIP